MQSDLISALAPTAHVARRWTWPSEYDKMSEPDIVGTGERFSVEWEVPEQAWRSTRCPHPEA